MNKEQLYNLAISKLSNKKISNAQKATVRQLVDAGVITKPSVKLCFKDKSGEDVSIEEIETLGGQTLTVVNRRNGFKLPEKEKPAKNKTGLGWWIVFTAAFLGSLAVEIASLCW